MEQKKRGRPATVAAKTIARNFRFTPAEMAILEETARMYDLSQNATVTRAIMELHQKAKPYKKNGGLRE